MQQYACFGTGRGFKHTIDTDAGCCGMLCAHGDVYIQTIRVSGTVRHCTSVASHGASSSIRDADIPGYETHILRISRISSRHGIIRDISPSSFRATGIGVRWDPWQHKVAIFGGMTVHNVRWQPTLPVYDEFKTVSQDNTVCILAKILYPGIS